MGVASGLALSDALRWRHTLSGRTLDPDRSRSSTLSYRSVYKTYLHRIANFPVHSKTLLNEFRAKEKSLLYAVIFVEQGVIMF